MNSIRHISLFALALICIGIMLLPQHIRESLYLNIEDFKQGQYWRFFSAHLTHYSWIHCLSNIVGLLLLIGIFNNSKRNFHWLVAALVTAMAISSGLSLFSAKLDWYVGFSGVLTGLYAYASIKTFNENTSLSIFILIALSGYVAIQVFQGELIDSMLIKDLNTSSHAHAYGLISGILYAMIEQYYLIISKDRIKQ